MQRLATSPDEIRQWLLVPEGSHFEFKEAKTNYHFEKLVDYCVALGNEGGGKIILGATDKRPRVIVGSAAFAEPSRTEAGLFDRLQQRIPVEEALLPEGRVVIVHVPSRLPGTAWQVDGRYLKRAGDDLVAMSGDELRAIFAEVGPDFSALPCPGATWADISLDAVSDFRTRWARKSRDERKLGWSEEKTLTDSELLVDGALTYAALILFGTRTALGRHLAQAEIIFEYRSSEASGPPSDRDEFREGFFLCHDALWQKINLRNDRQSYQEGLFRLEIPTFDEVPIREAILNAVAHRDYRMGGSVFVKQFSRRLEVISPGGFPVGITIENILDQQNPRNRRLAEALGKCGMIERSGQGVNLMVESAIRQSKPLPDFSGTSSHEVRLILPGIMERPAFVRFIERLGNDRLLTFSTQDFLLLDHVHRDQPVPDRLKSRIPNLLSLGAIEAIGRGRGARYILSSSLYAAMGARGTHTRKKGLDHETNKALLERHLRSQREAGAPLSELRQVLPALSEDAVQQLLHELKREGRVGLEGSRRWARWKIASKGPTSSKEA
jgi:ATP-dependent DNA helicase RecG